MRRLLAFVPIIVLAFAGPACHAAPAVSDPCVLLDWHDLQFMAITGDSPLDSSGWKHEDTPAALPGGSLSTALCSAITRSDQGRIAMTLNLSSVKGDVSEKQFAAWLQSVAAESAHANGKDVKEFKVDNADCESGRDETVIPALYEGDPDTTAIEYYVACDEHVGLIHASMNAQVAEGRKNELPDAAQVKALLDKSVARMKQTAFRTPD